MMERKTTLIESLVYYWLPVISWALVIFIFSANPTTPTSEIHWEDFIIKKTIHMIIFGIFTALLYRAIRIGKIEKTKAGYTAVITAMIYGITDEIHQSFTPGRMPRAYDVFFDTIGAILAIYIIWKYIPKAPKKLRNLARILSLN